MDVRTYWKRVAPEKLQNAKYNQIRQHGRVYELRREVSAIRRFFAGDYDCDIQTSFDLQTGNVLLLISGYGIDDNCLSLDNRREMEEFMRLRKLAASKKTLDEYLNEHLRKVKAKLFDRLNYRGVTEHEIRLARTDKMGLGDFEARVFVATLNQIMDRYFLEPD